MTNLIAMIEELRLLDRELKRLQLESDKLKKEITSQMGDAEEVKNELGHIIATWKEYIRESLDSKKLKESMPDVFNEYARLTVYKQFSLK